VEIEKNEGKRRRTSGKEAEQQKGNAYALLHLVRFSCAKGGVEAEQKRQPEEAPLKGKTKKI